MKAYILLITIIILYTGCNESSTVKPTNSNEVTKTYCKNPRPQICPMVYSPVCGKPTNKIYTNSCVACRDINVDYYIKSVCK